ncbi:hypothetical protein BU24DRAFT_468476 [Aaosphaeria arxii CBS 175.79]|uniref:Rhodopsin domain-containing protein n=1 Tax=Aaosphaeria arxii CBS 175.79 TaxID=1450172 RepID=A0A6A5X8K1_9PLEO|nr:uncharacterized protein BU24DRAFT_468476 [Aaosphaeria arxii CBS 175.79]KAF2009084.1 hypothetical protein BU24DRAFT_468476 [Aaosphaeria arxii CBS 175.79]
MAESNGPVLVISLWVMTGVTLGFIALRFFCKSVYSRQLKVDDAILLLAWTLTLIYSALVTKSVSYGLGKHRADIDDDNIPHMFKYMYLSEAFTLLAIPISKTSFAITLLRLVSSRWQKYFICFVIITMNVAMWLTAILLFLQCRPIAKNWDKDLEGSCWKSEVQDRYSIFAGVYSAVLDFILAAFPFLIIRTLKINLSEKIGVTVCMSLGVLAGIAAAVKTSYLPGTGNFTDMPYQIADLLIWSNAESAVTIMAASIPFFRVLFRNVGASWRGEGKSGATMTTGRGYGRNKGRGSYRLGSLGSAGDVGGDDVGGDDGRKAGVRVGIALSDDTSEREDGITFVEDYDEVRKAHVRGADVAKTRSLQDEESSIGYVVHERPGIRF